MTETTKAQVADGGLPQGMVMDTLVNMINGLGTNKDRLTQTNFTFSALNRDALEKAYRGDWIARKIVNIPAQDATREWREWQADGVDIGLIEDTERTLGVQRKVCDALIKGRLFGGSALLIGTDDAGLNLSTELDPKTIKKDGLKFLHVLTRWDLSAGPIDWDVSSKYYGEPEYYNSIARGSSEMQQIHPSRIARFLGSPVPSVDSAGYDGWSDSVLQAVTEAIISVGMVSSGGANLVNELKVDVIKVPNLTASLANKDYAARLTSRFGVANLAKSLYNMLLLDKEEEWERITANLAGLPDVLHMYLLIASGAADIPATRMLAQSPKGMNATGQSDTRNYYDHIAFVQRTDVEPRMSILDECIIRSALGDITSDVGYDWKSLWQMDEVQKSTQEKTLADAFKIDVDTALIPAVILREARLNQLIELGTYPGLDQILDDNGGVDGLDKLMEEEKAAAMPAPSTAVDPKTGKPLPPGHPAHAALAAANSNTPPVKGAPGAAPAKANPFAAKKKAVGDAAYRARRRNPRDAVWRVGDGNPRSLYIWRPVQNSADIIKWARSVGLNPTIAADDLHVTVCYSKDPIEWHKVAEDWQSDENGVLRIKPGGAREVQKFGTAIVLSFTSSALQYRHCDIRERADASYDYEEYTPHITIAYIAEAYDNTALMQMAMNKVEPYRGEIILGPECFEEIDGPYNPLEDGSNSWSYLIDEFNEEAITRVPAGGPGGGQFGSGGAETASKMSKVKDFMKSGKVQSAIKSVVRAASDRDNQKEALARAIMVGMYHGANMDMGADLEEAVRDQVVNFGANAKMTVMMAREKMRDGVNALIKTRLGGRIHAFAHDADAEVDPVLEILKKLKRTLDNDQVFEPLHRGDLPARPTPLE